MPRPKRGLVIADLHCGHWVGLTPKSWDSPKLKRNYPQHYKMRRQIWDWYKKNTSEKWDFVILNGDAIEGKGEKSGSTELIETDRLQQVEMAKACLQTLRYDKLFISYGTSYHTGAKEDFEDKLAKDETLKCEKIGGEDNLNVNGIIINYRHHVGRSTIPHGRHTSLARERLWNLLWAERGEYPKATFVIRSHVHYYNFCGGGGWTAITTPALCGYGSKYGGRRVTGAVDIGVVILDIIDKDNYKWNVPILRMPYQKPLSV